MEVTGLGTDSGFLIHIQCTVGAYFLGSRASYLSLSLTSLELLGDECEGVLLYICNGWFFVWISNVDC